MEPGVEPIGVAKSGQAAPGFEQGVLDDVPSELGVPDDHAGGRVESREGRAGQHGEGVMIALPCPLDEAPLVHGLPLVRARRTWPR